MKGEGGEGQEKGRREEKDRIPSQIKDRNESLSIRHGGDKRIRVMWTNRTHTRTQIENRGARKDPRIPKADSAIT